MNHGYKVLIFCLRSGDEVKVSEEVNKAAREELSHNNSNNLNT